MRKLILLLFLSVFTLTASSQVITNTWYATGGGGGGAPDCGAGTDNYGDTGASYATNTLNDDIVWYCSVDVVDCGTVTSVSIYVGGTGTTAAKFGIYTDNAGEPGTLLANGVSNEGALASGGYRTLTFATPPSVDAGTTYWVGILSDDDFTGWRSGSETVYFENPNPYASGFPATATPASTSGKGTGVYITVDHEG